MRRIVNKKNLNTLDEWNRLYTNGSHLSAAGGHTPTYIHILQHMQEHGVVIQKGLMDIGCGTGKALEDIQIRHGIKCCGLDLSTKLIDMDKENHPDVEFHTFDCEEDEIKDDWCERYDVAMTNHTLEHIENVYAHVDRVLDKMSYYVICVPLGDEKLDKDPYHINQFNEESFDSYDLVHFEPPSHAKIEGSPMLDVTAIYILKGIS